MTKAPDLAEQVFTKLGPRYTEPRPIQTQLLHQLMEDRPKLAMVEAPVGIGKSALGIAYGELIESKLTTVLTATISLQEQYERDFDDMAVFKGRGNYECENGLSAAEGVCVSRPGYRCDSDYYVMRREVERARRVAANYAVYLNHLFYSRLDRKPDLLVCDEGHRLLDILTQFETVKLDAGLCRKLKILRSGSSGWDSMEDAEAWARAYKSQVQSSMQDAIINGDKKAKLWAQLYRQITGIEAAGEDYITLKTGEVLEAAPLWPRKAAHALFRSAHNVLIQSATLYGGHVLADLLGMNPMREPHLREYQFYTVPSPFDSARWPTYFRPVVSLNKGSSDAEWARMAEVVHDYMHRYSSVKGVIHVSARNQVAPVLQSTRLCEGCTKRIIAPQAHGSANQTRGEMLQAFRNAPAGTWLCHYSVGEGEDFTGDLGRIQLIAKVPYPDLGDKLTRLRSEEPGVGRRMYAAMTLARIAQTAGRVMRHEGDFGETVILDGSFRRLWQWHQDLAPSWFKDVLVYR
jgi:Rad3-related DNA helicase